MRFASFHIFFFPWLILYANGEDQPGFNISLAKALFDLSDILKQRIEKDIVTEPNGQEVLQVPIEIVAGIPAKQAVNLINKICEELEASGNIQSPYSPDSSLITLILENDCTKFSVPVKEAYRLTESPYFDKRNPVYIGVSGWRNMDSTILQKVAKAFNCRGGYNFISFDPAPYLNSYLRWSVFNTKAVGFDLAVGIKTLAEVIPLENIHLFGHSLGAEVVGYAARYFKELTSTRLPHITGLDPIKPCFNLGHKYSQIFRDQADFVDIIHSSPGGFGIGEALGDLDYYPNGYRIYQPGCIDLLDTHLRSFYYYIDTIYPNNTYDYLATHCTSLNALDAGLCKGPKYPMGFAVSPYLRGKFFSHVNPQQPFGNNAGPDHQYFNGPCGQCPDNIEIVEL